MTLKFMKFECYFLIDSAFQKLQAQSCFLWGVLPSTATGKWIYIRGVDIVFVIVILLGLHFGKTYIFKIAVI